MVTLMMTPIPIALISLDINEWEHLLLLKSWISKFLLRLWDIASGVFFVMNHSWNMGYLGFTISNIQL